MKNRLFKIVKIVLYPLIWCYQVIQDAPIIDCDNCLISYSDYRSYAEPQKKTYSSINPTGNIIIKKSHC